MKKFHWLQRRRPAPYLISEYSSQAKLEDRYIQDSGIRLIPPSREEVESFSEPLEERVQVRVDCRVSVVGTPCNLETGEVGVVISGNEPTEPLKNMNTTIHSRIVASAPMLYHDPKYGGWDNPYKFRTKPQKKEKEYEYY